MATHKILTLPAPVLRRKARPVVHFSGALQKVVDDMVETMRNAPGVGLAAPQIGIPERIIVVEYPEDDQKEDAPRKLFVIINPEIIKPSAEVETGVEACLSVPGLVGEVERPSAVTVKGFNRHGQKMRLKTTGWLARIFQHEVDHLDGVLFVDRATRLWQPKEPVEDNV